MSAIKDGRVSVELDRERHLLFSLNALDEIQDKFGSYDKLPEVMTGRDSFKNVRWLLTLLLNEGAAENEEPLTEKQVGKLIHAGNIADVQKTILKAFAVGGSGTDEPGTEDDAGEA